MADSHLIALGADLDALDLQAIRDSAERLLLGRGDGVADVLLGYAQRAYHTTVRHSLLELQHGAGRRAYALQPDDSDLWADGWDDLEDEYGDYFVDLAGVTSEAVRAQVGETLAAEARKGSPLKDATEALKQVLAGFTTGRLRTIVRTEGTRVASASRRDVGERSSEFGLGPDWLIYSSILDNRTTRTCSFAHGHRRPFDTGHHLWDVIPPPNHYNCRAMERFGFEWDEEDMESPLWSPAQVQLFEQIKREEFPGWEQRPLPGHARRAS